MAIHPDSHFPILVSDQADVIRIFLELMSEGDRTARASEVTTDQPVGPRNDSNYSRFPDKLPNLE